LHYRLIGHLFLFLRTAKRIDLDSDLRLEKFSRRLQKLEIPFILVAPGALGRLFYVNRNRLLESSVRVEELANLSVEPA
jgi:hypothetical protein